MRNGRVVALTGGVGGAKLAEGLMQAVDRLTLVVNTGDDFNHLGLHISPDIDTALYTLSGLANPETGWGRKDETWSFMAALEQLGGESWFRLGDADLAMHVERTRRMANGDSLSDIVSGLSARLDIPVEMHPMSDNPVRTRVRTDIGELDFQQYFVREQCRPRVQKIDYMGASEAVPAPGVVKTLREAELQAVIICPSNPYLSIGPILSIPGMRDLLRASGAPVIAVSPLVGGLAVKGPTTKIMEELGLSVNALQVFKEYEGLIDGFVLDERDAHLEDQINLPTLCIDTLMQSSEDRVRVARATLAFANSL